VWGTGGLGDMRDRGTRGEEGQHALISPALAAHSAPAVTKLTNSQHSVSTWLEPKLPKSARKCSNTDRRSVSPLSEVGLTMTWLLLCNMQLHYVQNCTELAVM